MVLFTPRRRVEKKHTRVRYNVLLGRSEPDKNDRGHLKILCVYDFTWLIPDARETPATTYEKPSFARRDDMPNLASLKCPSSST